MKQQKLAVFAALMALAGWVTGSTAVLADAQGTIQQDAAHKTVTMADGQGHLTLRLNYDGRCVLDEVTVRGRQVLAQSGVSSGVRMGGQWYTTKTGIPSPTVSVGKDTLTVSNIAFGKPGGEIHETWRFTVQPDRIMWRISRRTPTAATLEDSAFPEWDFGSLSTWTGGILGNGGVVWDKYLDAANTTYGAHTGDVTFWNPQNKDCLRIVPSLPKGYVGASRFSHQPPDTSQQEPMSFNYAVSREELKPQHDFRRFLEDRQDLWAPFPVQPGEVSVEFALQALDYDEVSHLGKFQGVDGDSIRELINTVGRYGVIDNHLVGANGWRTGNICLHEQWFAQIGLMLGDPNYNANLASDLDFERDHAISPDGRVIARWSYDAGDAMPGTFDSLGFYEAQWGYLIDSQPDYVINVAEQYDLTGDTKWLAGQKTACEKALDYLIRREVGSTGLVTVLTDSRNQHRGSDWFDIIWASYENALVNAEFYHALSLWADSEDALGDTKQAAVYRTFAARLKIGFNKPIAEGGFWDPTNQWYVYWRDKDGSVHGNVQDTAVNFAAISYGVCDDPTRKKAILDGIETKMQHENLFHWPTNFVSYNRDEIHPRNYPFPNYENGDIFMSWGELGVRAYAADNPALAIKYVKLALTRYQADGLSFQRYDRKTQTGTGDDFLSGNCMIIVGLYRDIYGIQPKPNRLYLEPHLTSELDGTQLRYPLRGRDYLIDLSTTGYGVTSGGCTLRSTTPFGVNPTASGLEFFPGHSATWALSVTLPKAQTLTVQIGTWPEDPNAPHLWTEASAAGKGKVAHAVALLRPSTRYALKIDGEQMAALRTDSDGRLTFASASSATAQTFEIEPSAP
jgi:hypothetical protein